VVSDVIDILEALGANSDFADGSPGCLDALLQHQGLEPALGSALLGRDAGALQALLRAPSTVCCLINPAEPDEAEEEEEEEEQEDEDEDDEK
jgi:hypothetical protein